MDKEAVLKKFLEDKEVYKVIQHLKVILALVRKYWKKLMLKNFISWIEKINKDIADLIYLLDGIHLLKEKELSRFIRDLKQKVAEKYLDFRLYSNDEKIITPLKDFLERQFWKGVNLEYKPIESNNLTVHMKGHGYSFNRSLETDIDKLLA